MTAVASLGILVMAVPGCGGSAKGPATLRVEPHAVLRESDQEVPLIADGVGVEGCAGAEDKASDVRVEESSTEVDVTAKCRRQRF